MRLQLMEWAGAGLIAGALAWWHVALGVGALGVYLFTASIVEQLMTGGPGNGDG
jgi:hypothetical protein